MRKSKALFFAAALLAVLLAPSAFAQSADLDVSKTGPATALPGDDVAYTVTLANQGPSAAASVTLSDEIPVGLTFIEATQVSGPEFTCTTPARGESSGTVVCTAAALAASDVAVFNLVFNIAFGKAPGEEFTNVATVVSASPDPVGINNSDQVVTAVAAADVALTKTGPDQAAAGSDVSYTVTITNFGPDEATGISVEDAIPAGMTFVSATQESGPAFVCSTPAAGDPGSVICTAGSLASGATAEFTFVFNIPDGTPAATSFTNIVTVTSDADPNDENNSGVSVTTTPPLPQADLGVSKDGPAAAAPGTDITYTITLINGGPDSAENVTLTDTIPALLTFVSLEQNSGTAFNCTTPAVGAEGTVECNAASFAPGTAVFTLVVHVPAGTASRMSFTNSTTVHTTSADPNEENNSGTLTTTISSIDLVVSKTGPETAVAGDEIAYTLTLTNDSVEFASDVTLTDVLPAGTTFVSLVRNSGPVASCATPEAGATGTVTCTIGVLNAGASSTYTLTLKIGDVAQVQNTATVTTTESFDTDNTNDSDTVTTVVTPAADLSITKTGAATANAGENLTYTITATNNGPSAAANVSIADTLPTGTTFVSLVRTAGVSFSCTTPAVGANGTVTCTRASLAAGTSVTFALTVAIDRNLAAGTELSNSAAISTTTLDPAAGNNESTAPTTVSTSADAGVTKTAAPSVNAGANLTYVVTATNAGPSPAASVTLADVLPAGTTFVSATQTGGPAFSCTTPAVGAPGTITCTIAQLDPGATGTFSFVVAVAASTTPGTVISNTATIDTTTTDPDATDDAATAETTVALSADLSVAKNGPATATAGDHMTFTIGASNNGPSTASNVTVEDVLPAGTTLVFFAQNIGPFFNCTTPAVGANGTITCTIATFEAAETALFTVTVAVDSALANGTPLVNTATIDSATTDPDASDDSSTLTTTIAASADLGVTKAAPDSANAGETITYTVTATNSGPSDATNVTLTDVLPAGTTFVSATQTAGPAFNCTTPAVGANGTITCTRATFADAATATFEFAVEISPTFEHNTFAQNTATIDGTTADPNPGNDSTMDDTRVMTSADLAVVKSAPANANAGETITYTVTATNAGPSAASTVTLTDPLPAGTTFVSATQTAGPTFNCTTPAVGANGTITCTIATFDADATATFSFVVDTLETLAGGSTINNTASFVSETSDPDATDNSSAATTTVATSADLGVTKSAPATANAGDTITYTVTATNAGPSAAANVILTDALPAAVTFVSATQTAGPAFNCTTPAVGANGTITCTLATFAAGATATFSFVVEISEATASGSTIDNTAAIDATTADPDGSDDSSTASTGIATSADLGVTKSAPATANAGDPITYTVTATNAGPSVASSVTLTDVLPATVTFVSATQSAGPAFNCTTPAVGANGTITCTLATFAAGATATFSFVVEVSETIASGSTIDNTAAIDATTADPDGSDDSSTASTGIATSADLGVTKSAPATPNAGDAITYTVTATNAGPSVASNVTLTDVLPAAVTFVSATQTAGPAFNCTTPAIGANGTITCTVASLAPAASATFSFVVEISETTASGSTISNTATIDATTTDPDPSDDAVTASTTIATSADLGIAKSAPGTANAGDSITYTVTAINAGPSVASSVTLTDVLPAAVTFVSATQTAGPAFNCTTPAIGANGTITCTVASLTPGASATFSFVVEISETTASGSTISNTATIDATTADPDATDDSSTASTGIATSADVGVTKSAAATVNAGQNLTYTVTATNAGPSTAQSVTLTDALPAGTTFVSATQTAGPTFNCTTPAAGANGTITCTRASLDAGATATFAFVVRVAPSAANGSTLANTATIDTTTSDSDATDDAATASTTVATSADLGVTKSAPATTGAGGTLTYTITATNAGPADALNATLTDALPAGTTFVSLAQTTGPAFTCTTPAAGADGTVTCTRASFASAASATFSLVVAVPSSAANGSTLQNTATLDSDTSDPDTTDDSATAATVVTTGADLGVTKSGPAMTTAGADATYVVTVTNNGPSDAANVSLTDAVPANTTFVSATQTSGPTFTCATPAAGATGTITCTIASLASGASATFSFVFTVSPSTPDATVVTNVAEVNSATADANAANDSATANTTVGTGADVSVSKRGPATVTSGSDITYTVSVANAGPSNAADVTVTDVMPAGTTFVSAAQTAGPTFNCTTPATGANGTITCSIASLAAGATGTFELVFHLEPSTVGPIQNTASVSSPTDATPVNDASSTSAAVADGPTDVGITKTSSSPSVGPASTVTFTIVVTNHGPDDANDTVVTDNLPAGVALRSVSTTQGTCSGNSVVTCNVGTLAPNAQATITIVVDLPSTPGSFTNTATVDVSNADLNPANNAATATVSVAAIAAVPTLSPLALLALALMLVAVVLVRMT